MPKKLSEETGAIAAMTAAFQVLIFCLQNNGTLERGEFQEGLQEYIEQSKKEVGNEAVLTILQDLHQSLVD